MFNCPYFLLKFHNPLDYKFTKQNVLFLWKTNITFFGAVICHIRNGSKHLLSFAPSHLTITKEAESINSLYKETDLPRQ